MPDNPNPDAPPAGDSPPNPNPPNPSAIDVNSPEFKKVLMEEADKLVSQRTARIEMELNDLKQKAAGNPPPPNRDEFVPPTQDDMWKDLPGGVTRIVEHLLTKTVGPIVETAKELKSERVYENLKRQYAAADPINARIIEKCGQYVDQMVAKDPTPANMQAALFSLSGAIARGLVPGVTWAEISGTKIASPPGNPDAPNGRIAPSTPPTPKPDEEQGLRQLTDEEERMRIREGLSKKQFIELMDAPEIQVSRIGEILKPQGGK